MRTALIAAVVSAAMAASVAKATTTIITGAQIKVGSVLSKDVSGKARRSGSEAFPGRNGAIVFSGTSIRDSPRYHLYLMRPDGTKQRRITRGHAAQGDARWSPDGKWIAFASDRSNPGGTSLRSTSCARIGQASVGSRATVGSTVNRLGLRTESALSSSAIGRLGSRTGSECG